MKTLFKDSASAWKSAQRTVARGTAGAYDEACRLLVDLSEAHAALDASKSFREELKKFMTGHLRRKALVQRLVKAGIWEDR